MDKYRQLISDSIIFAIGNFLTKLISFFLMPIYTAGMTAWAFGLSDLLTNSLALIIPILSLSIGEAVFRFCLDKDSNPKLLLTNGIKVLAYSYVLILPICIIAYANTHLEWWILFGVLYVTESLKQLFSQFARGINKISVFAISGIVSALFLLIFTFIFIWHYKLEVNGYLWSFILSNIITILYIAYVIRINKYISFSENTHSLRAMLKYSIPLIPNTLSWWITNISSRYVIAAVCGISAAGLFSAASRLPALVNVVASIFQQAWQYATVRQHQSGDADNFFSNVFRYYSIFILSIGSILIALIPWISKFLLKGNFYEAWVYAPLLLLAAIIGCYSIFFGTFYQMVKKSKKIMYTTVIGAIINLTISLCTIPFIGLWGALIGSVSSYLAITIFRIYDCRKFISIHFNLTEIVITAGLVCIQAIILSFGSTMAIYGSYIIAFIIICINASKYRLLFQLFKHRTPAL